MKAQVSLELLMSFMAMVLVASILLSSFPHGLKQQIHSVSIFEKKQSIHAKLSSYYLTASSAGLKINCSEEARNEVVFNEKINSFLCSIKPSRRWFLK